MAKGIEARIKALETGQFHLYTQMLRVKAALFGKKDDAPKARKPRKPRAPKALGRDPLDPENEGIPATDPRYLDAPASQKKRGRRKKAGVEVEDAGGEG